MQTLARNESRKEARTGRETQYRNNSSRCAAAWKLIAAAGGRGLVGSPTVSHVIIPTIAKRRANAAIFME